MVVLTCICARLFVELWFVAGSHKGQVKAIAAAVGCTVGDKFVVNIFLVISKRKWCGSW